MRVDLYGLVHKGQRYRLFEFAQKLSRADLGEPSVQAWARAQVEALTALLADHAHSEERYIHPLFAPIGNADEHLEKEHSELEAALSTLVAITKEQRFERLYSATMRFIGNYLLHIDAEEAAQRNVLWPNYSDIDLANVMARFKAERAPEATQKDLELLLPAMNIQELVAFVRNTKNRTDPPDFEAFTRQAESAVGQTRWSEVCSLL